MDKRSLYGAAISGGILPNLQEDKRAFRDKWAIRCCKDCSWWQSMPNALALFTVLYDWSTWWPLGLLSTYGAHGPSSCKWSLWSWALELQCWSNSMMAPWLVPLLVAHWQTQSYLILTGIKCKCSNSTLNSHMQSDPVACKTCIKWLYWGSNHLFCMLIASETILSSLLYWLTAWIVKWCERKFIEWWE